MVLNLQGFPGSVAIDDSTFTKNMVYIRDILIREYSDRTHFIDVDEMATSIFERQPTYHYYEMGDPVLAY